MMSAPEAVGSTAMTPNQVAEAYRASLNEHRMTLFEAMKTYKKALFWSAVMGLVSQALRSPRTLLRNPQCHQHTW